MSHPLELLLFTHDPSYAGAAVAAGMDAIVVDWETRGKASRQSGFDTEIAAGNRADLDRARAATPGPLICRINNEPSLWREDLKAACDGGASEIWLPMVRRPDEVEQCLAELPPGRSLSILAETPEAVALADRWNDFPLARVYVGLNDLAIASGSSHLFAPILDGRLESFAAQYRGRWGFAGVTDPLLGNPVPCELLLAEMARLGCSFGVTRRSFRRDVPAPAIGGVLRRIRTLWADLIQRDAEQKADDHARLRTRLSALFSAAARAV